MNEVEKLYSLAGVEKEFDYLECHRGTSSICCPLMDYESERDEQCEGCVNSSKMQEVYSYPDFTAEKQLELIKWLGKKNYSISIHFHENEWGIATEDYSGYFQDNLSDALASIINTHWQDLTEEEKQQIKEILE